MSSNKANKIFPLSLSLSLSLSLIIRNKMALNNREEKDRTIVDFLFPSHRRPHQQLERIKLRCSFHASSIIISVTTSPLDCNTSCVYTSDFNVANHSYRIDSRD